VSDSSTSRDIPAEGPAEAVVAAPPTAEPRQRWRLVLARAGVAAAAEGGQRDVAEAWLASLESAGLPLARTEGARARARISFGAPLPVAMAANGELVDVVLTERWPAWRVREALDGRVPAGWQLVDLHDVWLAGPPLAGRVAAADYRITLASAVATDPVALRRAAQALLAAARIPRQRPKGAGSVEYDLRALLLDVRIEGDGPPLVVVTRTRFHPELGTGRPEEVVAALGEVLGVGLEIGAIVRDRLVLAEDLD
jgi:radical SAM-linked protein